MSDEKTTSSKETVDFDRVQRVDLQVEMQRSYLDYAMSVIVGRALLVQDGLKPVQSSRPFLRDARRRIPSELVLRSRAASSAMSWATTTRTVIRRS